jgi:Delta3-Delta2-enoyl-CoA isomerase
MLTLTCDYRVMIDGAKRNVWITMNEVRYSFSHPLPTDRTKKNHMHALTSHHSYTQIHFGAVLPHSFGALMRAKFPSSTLLRKIALEGHRFTPQEALAEGLLDYIAPSAEVLNKAIEIAEGIAPNARTGVWGLMKRDLYMNVLEACVRDNRVINARVEDERAKARL